MNSQTLEAIRAAVFPAGQKPDEDAEEDFVEYSFLGTISWEFDYYLRMLARHRGLAARRLGTEAELPGDDIN